MTNMRYESTINMITNKKQASFYWMNVKCKKLTKKMMVKSFSGTCAAFLSIQPTSNAWRRVIVILAPILLRSSDYGQLLGVFFTGPPHFQYWKEKSLLAGQKRCENTLKFWLAGHFSFQFWLGQVGFKTALIPLGTHHKAQLKSAAIFPWIPPFHAFSLQGSNRSVGKQSFLSTLVFSLQTRQSLCVNDFFLQNSGSLANPSPKICYLKTK